jgi:hypothetical protein
MPDLETLRVAGVESPSGRLIIDLSRFRESRAFASRAGEVSLAGNSAEVSLPPSPPTPTPKSSLPHQASPELEANRKKESKVASFVNKMKRILKF